ncbi:MAG: ABC-2 family transporter protein [Ruminococcus sp.]|nr:ABC-2 family transporter protein [Ruminococcus sp.]
MKFKKFIRTYRPFTRAGMLESVAYRANFFCFLIGEIMSCFIMFFVWKAVFQSSNGETFMGFTMEDMVVYLFITFLTGYLTYSDGTYAIATEIRDGSIAMRMIKPCSFDMCFLFQELGNKIINVLFIFAPLVIGVEAYRWVITGACQFNISYFLLYVVSLIMAYLISFYFNVSYGFMAFYLKNLWGADILKECIINFLSGATIPLAFMPTALANVLSFLPFSSLSYTPVMIYMGMYSGEEIAFKMLMQVFWLMVMVLLSKAVWNHAVKRLCSQGG